MTKRKLVTLLAFTIFAIGIAGDADAQFWKKKAKRHSHKSKKEKKDEQKGTEENGKSKSNAKGKSGEEETPQLSRAQRKKEKKEQKRREKEERKKRALAEKQEKKDKKKHKNKDATTTVAPQQTVIRKWSDIEYVATQKKQHYRVDILAPMYLDELVKNGYPVKTIPEKAVAGLDFYKGVQIAADTLKKAAFDIDVYVHDIASLLESTEMLVHKNIMDSSDLIIGAVPTKDVAALAAYAKTKHINFISALSPADGGVKDNPYFTLLQPSLKSHCEWINKDVAEIHAHKKPVLLYRTTTVPDENAFRYLTGEKDYSSLYRQVMCNTKPAKEALAALLDTTHTNVIVIAVVDNAFADSLLKMLATNFPNAKCEVYGMPTWASMQSIAKTGSYPNLSINITSPFTYDVTSKQGQYVADIYKKEYGGKPQDMAYRGYETMYWYANLLKRYGTIFNKQYSDNETAPFTKFEIKPQWDDKGDVIYHENRRISIRKFENGNQKSR